LQLEVAKCIVTVAEATGELAGKQVRAVAQISGCSEKK